MTFRHMVTYQIIVLRVFKHVQYAKKTLLLNIETWKEDNISSASNVSYNSSSLPEVEKKPLMDTKRLVVHQLH